MPSGRWMIPKGEVRRLRGGRNPEIQAELRTIAEIASWMLKNRFRDAIVDVKLFGSVARGEADEESDVDLLTVVKDKIDESELERELGDMIYDIMLATGRFVQLLIYKESGFEDAKSWNPTVRNILREGIKL
ncbi:TPA: nucleotidyltransferase domain-containing protein [Candidatus Bathyarchaeota archaeon]|nr:nucleotidyltransferase domain-containing protein [Candidatus Bathyarchaeota archaeon]